MWRDVRSSAPRIARWLVVYLAWFALLWSVRVSVVDAAGKVWDLRIRQVWRLPSSAVSTQAPWAYPLYAVALAGLVLGVPMTALAIARLRDRPADVAPEGSPALVPVDEQITGLSTRAWCVLALPLCLVAASVMIPTSVTATWQTDSGSVHVANGFATGAHPLDVSAAERLWGHVTDGDGSGWMAHHQGGYPAESRSLGLAATTLLLRLLSGGRLPVTYAHTLVAVGVFFLPLAIFYRLGRRDEWPPAVAAGAAIFHLVVPGAALSGGYRTLVELGNVNDVGAAVCVLAFVASLLDAMFTASRRAATGVALWAAAALWWSPQSAIALCAATAGAVVAQAARDAPDTRRVRWRAIGKFVLAGALLAAPAWLPIVLSLGMNGSSPRAYSTPGEYVYASLETLTPPVLAVAVFGAAAILRVRRPAGIAAVVTVLLLALIALLDAIGAPVPGVDAGRLLPFQRLLCTYLAAVGLHAFARRAAAVARLRSPRAADLLQATALAVLALVFAGPVPMSDGRAKGLFEPTTVTDMHVADLAAALRAARAPAGTNGAVLLVGPSQAGSVDLSLWAPVLSHGLFFYKDPVWHWGEASADDVERVWDPRARAIVPRVLTSDSLSARGIAAVVVAADAREAARRAPATLALLREGSDYDAYAVRAPSRVIDWAGDVAQAEVSDNWMRAQGTAVTSVVDVRRNWHPGWRATVNGAPVPVQRTGRGFMRLTVTPGPIDLRLHYDGAAAPRLQLAAVAIGILTLVPWRRATV